MVPHILNGGQIIRIVVALNLAEIMEVRRVIERTVGAIIHLCMVPIPAKMIYHHINHQVHFPGM